MTAERAIEKSGPKSMRRVPWPNMVDWSACHSVARAFGLAGLLSISANGTALAGYEEGVQAFRRGDYAAAMREWTPLAIAGHARAQALVGSMYLSGQGTARDERVAIEWLRKAAAQGEAGAQVNLGMMYENGTATDKSYEQAVFWYRKAAEQGNARGQSALGFMQLVGRGTPRDDAAAVEWLQKASAQNEARADYLLAAAYRDGRGVPRNFELSVQHSRRAAERGHAGAQVQLGLALEHGRGVQQDLPAAASWYRKAVELGETEGFLSLGILTAAGKGVPRDDAAAAELFRRAAERGNVRAQRALAAMYGEGRGVGRDPGVAAMWQARAAAADAATQASTSPPGPLAPAPATATQSVSSGGTAPLPRTSGLPVRLGDSIEQVQAVLGDGVRPEVSLTMTANGQREDQGEKFLRHRPSGVWVFFARDGRARTIRLEAPFAGNIAGVRIGDNLATLFERLGPPEKPPISPTIPESVRKILEEQQRTQHLYSIDGTYRARFDIGPAGTVATVYLLASPQRPQSAPIAVPTATPSPPAGDRIAIAGTGAAETLARLRGNWISEEPFRIGTDTIKGIGFGPREALSFDHVRDNVHYFPSSYDYRLEGSTLKLKVTFSAGSLRVGDEHILETEFDRDGNLVLRYGAHRAVYRKSR